MKDLIVAPILAITLFMTLGCVRSDIAEHPQIAADTRVHAISIQNDSIKTLQDAAVALTLDEVVYDPAYVSIPYLNGDVPAGTGVCSDVVIRAYRKLGVDLQKLVHEDMTAHFEEYPDNWGLKKPDSNIDHRRVPNLMKFLERQGASLGISTEKQLFQPGDIVAWNLGGGIVHIGILVSDRNEAEIPLVVHNIGAGQVQEDILFDHKIIGHYRWRTTG